MSWGTARAGLPSLRGSAPFGLRRPATLKYSMKGGGDNGVVAGAEGAKGAARMSSLGPGWTQIKEAMRESHQLRPGTTCNTRRGTSADEAGTQRGGHPRPPRRKTPPRRRRRARVLPRRHAGRSEMARGFRTTLRSSWLICIWHDGRLKHVDDTVGEDDVPSNSWPANRRLLQRYRANRHTHPQDSTPRRRLPPHSGSKCIGGATARMPTVAGLVSRVAFEDGALKTVPLEELEPLSTPETSRQPKSSRTGSRTDRVTDQAALEAKLREDNWTVTEVPRAPGKDGKKPTQYLDKYYRKPGESKQYRSLLGVARAHSGVCNRRSETAIRTGDECVGPPGLLLNAPGRHCQVRLGDGAVLEEFCSVGAAADKLDICAENLKEFIGKSAGGRGPRVSLQDTAAAATTTIPALPVGRHPATAAAAADGTVRDLLIGYY